MSAVADALPAAAFSFMTIHAKSITEDISRLTPAEKQHLKHLKRYWGNLAKETARNKAYKLANAEQIAAKKKAYRSQPDVKEREKLRRRAYYLSNKERELAQNKAWIANNQERQDRRLKEYFSRQSVKERSKAWRLNDRQKNPEKWKEAYRRNHEKHRLKRLEYIKQRVAKDPKAYYQRAWQLKKVRPVALIADALRKRLNLIVKKSGIVKSAKTRELLGCTFKEFLIRLESQFKPGMSWANYGLHGWHIDHIRPCASFDLSKAEEQRQCFHYSNLQPLWATDNRRKNARIT